MNEPKRAWIYGRVSDREQNELLAYQIDMLENYANEHNYAIVGSTRAFDSGKSLDSYFMMYLINSVITENMDSILVYSTNRLLIDPEKFEEFELICKMHNVSIITIK